jgi:preprotein translocase subunit YajC
MFRPGDRVVWVTAGGRTDGTVEEVNEAEDEIVVRMSGSYIQRARFHLDGRGYSGLEYRGGAPGGGNHTRIERVPYQFQPGDRVVYIGTWHGVVDRVTDQWVFATVDGVKKYFRLDGHGTRNDLSAAIEIDGYYLADHNHRDGGPSLKLEYPQCESVSPSPAPPASPSMPSMGSSTSPSPSSTSSPTGPLPSSSSGASAMREYPPEPMITYGVFCGDGRPIQPGAAPGSYRAGYGILNPPSDFVGYVAPTSDDRNLIDYLNYAKIKWAEEKLTIDFAAIENPIEFLVGCRVRSMAFYSDQITFNLLLPREIDPAQSGRSFKLAYGVGCAVPGIMSAANIRAALAPQERNYSYDYAEIIKVEGVELWTNRGDHFAFVPRFDPDFVPTAICDDATKTLLVRNLDMQRARRDSTQEDEVAVAA